MSYLLNLGISEAEYTLLTTGTDEDKTNIAEKIKTGITANVQNDPEKYKSIIAEGKLQSFKEAQKKIAKELGVEIEAEDDVLSIVKKGKEFFSKTSSETLQKLQQDIIDGKASYEKLKNEDLPQAVANERYKVNQVYIHMGLTSSASKLDKSILNQEDRVLIGKQKLASLGIELSYDNGKVIALNKETGLMPQIGERTFKPEQIDELLSTVLDGYNQKSNPPPPSPTGQPTPTGVRVDGQMSEAAKAKLASYDSFNK